MKSLTDTERGGGYFTETGQFEPVHGRLSIQPFDARSCDLKIHRWVCCPGMASVWSAGEAPGLL